MTLAPINKDKILNHCNRVIDNYDVWLVEFRKRQYANYLERFEKRKKSFPWRLFARWMKPKTKEQFLNGRHPLWDDSVMVEGFAKCGMYDARRLKALCEASNGDVLLDPKEYNQLTSEQ